MRNGIHTGNPWHFGLPSGTMNFYRIFISLLIAFALENQANWSGGAAFFTSPRGLVRGSTYRCLDAQCYREARFFGGEGMDIIYLLILAGLYVVTHGLVWALGRLGKSP